MTKRKSIFITGAASGIGLETARLFAGKGWYVGIVDLNGEGLKALSAEIGEENCFSMIMDVTDRDQVNRVMAAFARKTGGQMNALFNNAGILCFGHFEKTDLNFEHSIVDVNIKGIVTCTKNALPYLKATSGAHLINMASISAIYGIPDLSVYSATKAAVCALTEAWDIEFEKYDITVSDVMAPFIKTPMLKTSEDVYLMKSMGVKLRPEDLARVIWKAANGNKLHWRVGSATYAMIGLFWLLPFIKRFVIKKMSMR